MNKKMTIAGIFVAIILGVVGVNALLTSYSSLGYSIETTEVTEEHLLEDCFSISETTTKEDIRELAITQSTELSSGYDSKGTLSLYVIPEESIACWSLPVNITTQEKIVVYSNKSIVDEINNVRYDFVSKKWDIINPKVSASSSQIEYCCTVEELCRPDCISISGSRCYLNEEKTSWDTCLDGGVYGQWMNS